MKDIESLAELEGKPNDENVCDRLGSVCVRLTDNVPRHGLSRGTTEGESPEAGCDRRLHRLDLLYFRRLVGIAR
jgi:hypothetical protein